tara:strand:+ start:4189 stop:5313 length:1125 start_codon:yes stop_codon:yes gene_type:complete
MINVIDFYKSLKSNGIKFFTGVPDSLLKDICGYISDIAPKNDHVITANEGGAIGLAIGHHMATGNTPLIYMQNSGLGNSINPLLSLADPDVYSIPMILLVGWRGEPGVKDEPQHVKQGRIHSGLIEAMDIPHFIISANSEYEKKINDAVALAEEKSCPVILSIKKGSFEKYKIKRIEKTNYEFTREQAVKNIVNLIDDNDIIVSTTGKTSRELFEYRKEIGDSHNKDFLTVGGMGHANQIALGIALAKPKKTVYCFDGDGAILMHCGSMGIIGNKQPKNFKHIILNNGSHDSVGGQPTISFDIEIDKIAQGFQYNKVFRVTSSNKLTEIFNEFKITHGPCLLEILVNKGARINLGRPTISPKENKNSFMRKLKN